MTDRELMQQALDALLALRYRSLKDEPDGVITALRDRLAHCDRCGKRLGGEGDIHTCTPDPIGDAQDKLIAELAAQPEQEPYGWVQPNPSFNSGIFNLGSACPSGWVGSAIAVHTAPPTAQQIDEAYAVGYSNGMTEGYGSGKAYAAAQPVQVGLNVDPTPISGWGQQSIGMGIPSQPEQEPVASVPIHPKTGPLWAMTTDKPDPERLPSYPLMSLYTTPPAAQRKPLTPDELADQCEAWLQSGGANNITHAFQAGYRQCEAANGITGEKP